MGRLASARIREGGSSGLDLVRGLAQALPFKDHAFDTLVSTFPSEYIVDPLTLAEARRVLAAGGRLVMLPLAWPRNQLLGWLFKITGETPSDALEIVKSRFVRPLQEAGLRVDIQTLEERTATLLVIIAELE